MSAGERESALQMLHANAARYRQDHPAVNRFYGKTPADILGELQSIGITAAPETAASYYAAYMAALGTIITTAGPMYCSQDDFDAASALADDMNKPKTTSMIAPGALSQSRSSPPAPTGGVIRPPAPDPSAAAKRAADGNIKTLQVGHLSVEFRQADPDGSVTMVDATRSETVKQIVSSMQSYLSKEQWAAIDKANMDNGRPTENFMKKVTTMLEDGSEKLTSRYIAATIESAGCTPSNDVIDAQNALQYPFPAGSAVTESHWAAAAGVIRSQMRCSETESGGQLVSPATLHAAICTTAIAASLNGGTVAVDQYTATAASLIALSQVMNSNKISMSKQQALMMPQASGKPIAGNATMFVGGERIEVHGDSIKLLPPTHCGEVQSQVWNDDKQEIGFFEIGGICAAKVDMKYIVKWAPNIALINSNITFKEKGAMAKYRQQIAAAVSPAKRRADGSIVSRAAAAGIGTVKRFAAAGMLVQAAYAPDRVASSLSASAGRLTSAKLASNMLDTFVLASVCAKLSPSAVLVKDVCNQWGMTFEDLRNPEKLSKLPLRATFVNPGNMSPVASIGGWGRLPKYLAPSLIGRVLSGLGLGRVEAAFAMASLTTGAAVPVPDGCIPIARWEPTMVFDTVPMAEAKKQNIFAVTAGLSRSEHEIVDIEGSGLQQLRAIGLVDGSYKLVRPLLSGNTNVSLQAYALHNVPMNPIKNYIYCDLPPYVSVPAITFSPIVGAKAAPEEEVVAKVNLIRARRSAWVNTDGAAKGQEQLIQDAVKEAVAKAIAGQPVKA